MRASFFIHNISVSGDSGPTVRRFRGYAYDFNQMCITDVIDIEDNTDADPSGATDSFDDCIGTIKRWLSRSEFYFTISSSKFKHSFRESCYYSFRNAYDHEKDGHVSKIVDFKAVMACSTALGVYRCDIPVSSCGDVSDNMIDVAKANGFSDVVPFMAGYIGAIIADSGKEWELIRANADKRSMLSMSSPLLLLESDYGDVRGRMRLICPLASGSRMKGVYYCIDLGMCGSGKNIAFDINNMVKINAQSSDIILPLSMLGKDVIRRLQDPIAVNSALAQARSLSGISALSKYIEADEDDMAQRSTSRVYGHLAHKRLDKKIRSLIDGGELSGAVKKYGSLQGVKGYDPDRLSRVLKM